MKCQRVYIFLFETVLYFSEFHLPFWDFGFRPPLLVDPTIMFTRAELLQSCLILCNPMDCSPPGSSIHGILQARILEWVAMPSSRGSFQPRDQAQASHIAGKFFIIWATWEAHTYITNGKISAKIKFDKERAWIDLLGDFPGSALHGNHLETPIHSVKGCGK